MPEHRLKEIKKARKHPVLWILPMVLITVAALVFIVWSFLSADRKYNNAVSAWKAGDLKTAVEVLTGADRDSRINELMTEITTGYEAEIRSDEAEKLWAEADTRARAVEEERQRAEADARSEAAEEAALKAAEEAARKAEEEAKLKAEQDARLKAEEEAKQAKEELALLKAAGEERLQAEEEARVKAEEEAALKAEEEAARKAEEEAKLKAEQDARLKAEEEAKQAKEELALLKAAGEERLQAEEETRVKAEEEAALKAEEEAARKAEEEAKLKAEQDARLKAEEEAKQAKEELALLKAAGEERLQAEEEARVKAEEEAALKAEEEAARKAEEEAKLKAEQDARLKAEEETKQAKEELALLKAAVEERLQAEEEARAKAEEEAAREAKAETAFTVGSIVRFGHYEQDADISSGPEPLEWIVLSYDGQSAVMMTRHAVDTLRFHRPSKAATWETSNIRQWLNETFINDAFTDEERARLISETLTNKDVTYNGRIVRGGADTVDKVWLLSPEELERYLPKNKDRRAEITPYAESHGGWSNKAGYCYWWLRGPVGGDTYSAKYAAVDGSVSSYAASAETRCVRPVIRVDVNDPDLF